MPAEFDACVKAGGKVRTISIRGGKYAHVCVRPKEQEGPEGGRTVMGEIKRAKVPPGKR